MALTNTQIEIKYNSLNPNKVIVGDDIVLNIGSQYFATIIRIKSDVREKKLWAYLRSRNKMCPFRADISDCQKIQNVI